MKLIDPEEVYKFANEQMEKETGAYTKGQNKAWGSLKAMLHSRKGFKTIDAEPVVHCKDCIYKSKAKTNKNGFVICPASGMEIKDNDFCSYGTKEKNNKD